MKGSEFLISALTKAGVDTVFGYPGGAIMPVYDALVGASVKHILCRHEQGAALAADGYARSSGRLGVCLATSGPGATNLVTGLANAYMDSVPVLAITGQVASPLIGTDAFQEVDILGITLPVVKHSFLVERVDELPEIISAAIQIALHGRPGPVLIDIPKDTQLAELPDACVADSFSSSTGVTDTKPSLTAEIRQALALLKQAHRPLAYIGGGVGIANAEAQLQSFLQQTQIPAVSTLKGLGATGRYPLHLGMLGMHGLKAANYAVHECDLLISFGARFDDRATGNLNQFAPNAKVIHFDIDPAEFSKLKQAHLSVCDDLKRSLTQLINEFNNLRCHNSRWIAWSNWCLQQKEAYRWPLNAPGKDIYAPRLLARLSECKPKGSLICCDVGQHQMWVAQHCEFEHCHQHLSSGGAGTMGYGLPAAIGAQFAHPSKAVINVCGDGSFAMNIQELMTLKRYQLPIKILLIDNASLGMVRQWQHLFFDDRYSEVDLSDNPDFVQVAKAFGLKAKRITQQSEECEGIEWLFKQQGPCLLQVCISNQSNVWPLVPPGKANSEMLEEKTP